MSHFLSENKHVPIRFKYQYLKTPSNLTAMVEQCYEVSSTKDPIHSSVVLERHRGSLTRFECLEIIQYEHIYFTGKHYAKMHEMHEASVTYSGTKASFTDEKGQYCILPGDHIQYRYEMLRFIASGSFGSVYKCKDHKTGNFVAVKISTQRNSILKEAEHETSIMQSIQTDASGTTYYHPSVVKMYDFFRFRRHVVIVYELLGMDLYEHMKILQFRGCKESFVKCIAVQIFDALGFLHDRNIAHCDVKPENILLCGLGSTSVKLIDFGSSCHPGHPVFAYVQSRYYRAPEVLLGLPYGSEIDVWSLGCVLFELVVGKPLFYAKTEGQMLTVIASLLGPVPEYMVKSSTRRSVYFKADSNEFSETCKMDSSQMHRLYEPGTDLEGLLRASPSSLKSSSLGNLLAQCLQWDPKNRITPQKALMHPWFGSFSTRYIRPSSHHIAVEQMSN